jgi:putative flippase GtrA
MCAGGTHDGRCACVFITCQITEGSSPIPTITPLHRFIRFALVGLIGVPINLLLLALFLHVLGNRLYPLALVASWEISTTINFVLNQIYTYGEQNIHGWDWPKRAFKAQATNLSSQLVTFVGVLLLKEVAGVNPYLASLIGMAGAFLYNFVMSNRFVFLPKISELPTQANETAYRIEK